MFKFFESRIEPYPAEEPTQPPSTLVAFCWHYSKPVVWWLIAMSVLTAAMAAGEVVLFGFLGSIVDWLSTIQSPSSKLFLLFAGIIELREELSFVFRRQARSSVGWLLFTGCWSFSSD